VAVAVCVALVWACADVVGSLDLHGLVDEHDDGAGQAFEAVFEYEVDGLVGGCIGVLLFDHVCVLVVVDTLLTAPVAGQHNWPAPPEICLLDL
jgi:hypothetical protein